MPTFESDQSSLTIHKSPTSAAFHGFVRRLHLASQSDDPVLLAGEVGTGKRQSASTIHNVGGRSGGNFVQIDCLGIKESKFELEMLGALNPYNHQLRQGAVALAEGGTLYLHEVGELPAACQTLLLRLVESNTYSPVNSSDTYNSDFRLIASSSQDLMAMVEHGKFRNDLLHHINTLTIRAPSLNERREDIADLVRSILLEMSVASVKQLTPEAMEVLCHHKYTANILELRNIIHRLVGTFETDHPRHQQFDRLAWLPTVSQNQRPVRCGLFLLDHQRGHGQLGLHRAGRNGEAQKIPGRSTPRDTTARD